MSEQAFNACQAMHNKLRFIFFYKKFYLEKELSNEVRIDKLKDHINVKHKVTILRGIITKLNLLNKDKRSQIIEIMLIRNGFRRHSCCCE